jgi:DNA-directed RNA polymerase specialized sigma24 family protein
MSDFRDNLRRILANRHGPEAGALFHKLLEQTHRRVRWLSSHRCHGLFSESEQEEIIGDVMYQLMEGGLVRFRGETPAELHAFVRTIADRTTWRAADRRIREREIVERVHIEMDARWTSRTSSTPDRFVDWVAESPLSEKDRTYLRALIQAGSKAELARRDGISRAAVTQRVQRIRDRIAALEPGDRASHEGWMLREASQALDSQAG